MSIATETPRARQGERIAAALVLALTAALYFARLGARALWSSEERWAEIAREMILASNYFWPTINGHVYYDKPLLSYWFVVGATYLTGAMNEAAARIPSAIAGLLGVAILIALARRLYDLRTGVLAGFVLATSYSYVFFSRHASADVETVTGELAVLLLFWRYRQRGGGSWVIAMWLIMAITSLTKGLLGFALPLVVIGTYSCLAEGWHELFAPLSSGRLADRLKWLIARNRWFFNWYTLPAVALALVFYCLPFEISRARMSSNAGLNMVVRENVMRFFRPFDHRGPIYLYAYVIFALMAPWAVFIPAALIHAHRQRTDTRPSSASDRFVMSFFWATFLFFTLSGSRRSYYILPILPAAAILMARLFTDPEDEMSVMTRRLMRVGYAMIAIAAMIGLIALLPPSTRPGNLSLMPPVPGRAILALFLAVMLASAGYTLANFHARAIAGSSCVVAYLSLAYLFVFGLPGVEPYRGEKPFAQEVRRHVGDDLAKLALYNDQGPIFYIAAPHPIAFFDDPRAIAESINAGRTAWVIVRRRDAGLVGPRSEIVAAETSYRWEGERELRNKQLLLKVAPAAIGGSPR
jgi:4-amino-4-deoxy-L-arabinose transferase-like glycosyltransferase